MSAMSSRRGLAGRRGRALTNERARLHLRHMSTNHEHVMASTVLSVRVPEELKEQLDYLSNATKRSKAYLAAEALTEYVHRNAWKAKELHEALAEADKGEFISHEAMTAWADSLGTSNELPPPEPDVFLKR